MVNGKHAKALNFIVNMNFNDSFIGFAAETEQCGCLIKFLGEEVPPIDVTNFLAILSSNLWE